MAYQFILLVHSYLRYLFILIFLIVLWNTAGGFINKKAWSKINEKFSVWMIRIWNIEFVLGLLLYFSFSPLTRYAFSNFNEVMKDEQMRQFTIEHPVIMLIATAFLHIGWARSRKATVDSKRYKQWLIFIILSFALVVVGIPWTGRPLLRII